MTFRVCGFIWDAKAEVMRLAPRFRRIAQEQFRDAEEYPLEVREHRSSKAHAFYFASIGDAWANLNDKSKEVLQTANDLRGWALIQTGWCDQTVLPCPDKDTAVKWAIFARKMASAEGYAEIVAAKHDGQWYLRIRVPRSQSRAAMNKEEFTKSSRDVLDILAGTIDVTRKELESAGKRSAA